MKDIPWRGILVNDESELIVGGSKLSKFSLDNPTIPTFIKHIKLSKNIHSLVKISEDALLCG
jgi:hypothetical protein